ncbi:hypothetical protein, partial [Pseudomonas syringae group genomosp. 7]|uniref:hypothetical protein n=1 Tax=Pseudomonas syringae group genomosp. 7 TaxID=251699 RepID=UPI003770755B
MIDSLGDASDALPDFVSDITFISIAADNRHADWFNLQLPGTLLDSGAALKPSRSDHCGTLPRILEAHGNFLRSGA